MNDQALLERITSDPAILAGKPVIRGSRLSVAAVLNLLGHGMSLDEIVADHPGITRDDVRACLVFANRALEDVTFMPVSEAI